MKVPNDLIESIDDDIVPQDINKGLNQIRKTNLFHLDRDSYFSLAA